MFIVCFYAPVTFTAGKFYNASLETFAAVTIILFALYLMTVDRTVSTVSGGRMIAKKIINTELQLSAVLYGCESWSLTLREEHRLRVMRTEC
jgi:hypothetical protein